MSEGNSFQVGVVKWFNAQKAFGFISLPEGGSDVFVHAKELRKSGINSFDLEGKKVKFRQETGPKGQFAVDISLVEPGEPQ